MFGCPRNYWNSNEGKIRENGLREISGKLGKKSPFFLTIFGRIFKSLTFSDCYSMLPRVPMVNINQRYRPDSPAKGSSGGFEEFVSFINKTYNSFVFFRSR